MKLTETQKLIISFVAGVLLTVLTGIGIYHESFFENFTPAQSQQYFRSGQITKNKFDSLKNEYYKDNKALKIKHLGKFPPIEAFIFDVNQIDSIIHFNQGLESGKKPDSIAVYFGKDGETVEKPSIKHPNLRMIILGTKTETDSISGKKHSKLLTKNRNDPPNVRIPGKISVYDKATSVPPSPVQ